MCRSVPRMADDLKQMATPSATSAGHGAAAAVHATPILANGQPLAAPSEAALLSSLSRHHRRAAVWQRCSAGDNWCGTGRRHRHHFSEVPISPPQGPRVQPGESTDLLPRATRVCDIVRRRSGARAYLKIGNEVSLSLPPITTKRLGTFGEGFDGQIFLH